MLRRGRHLLASLLALAALPAGASPRVAGRVQGAAEPLVVFAEADRLLVDDGGRRAPLAAPPGLHVAAAVRLGAGWLVAGARPTAGGSELWLARESGELAAPPAVAPMRLDPQPLMAGDRLLGLAWLEGESRRQLAVRFAPWGGDRFGAASVVVPPGAGSQLALSGARLDDGRILLVWAGYDGVDDEIWATWGDGARWTAPVRVGGDNRVPDITPDVVASGDGALVAWSRYDGSEYRLAVSRFDDETFSPPRWVAAPGSMEPTFERGDAGLALLYRDARQASWALAELTGAGAPGRTARLRAPTRERPAVRWTERGPTWTLGAGSAATAWD